MNETSSPLAHEDAEAVVRRYQARIIEHGTTFDSMASGSVEKQRIRHSIHATALRGERPQVLDVGCGLGQFYHYLRETGRDCAYTGYDIVPEYVAACRELYPQAQFEERNIFEDGIGVVYDTIVMSQVLNNRYQASDNMAVMRRALALAFEHTRTSVSVDMMSAYVDFQNPDLFYYAPEAIFSLARSITRRVIIRHDYRPFEFCVQLFHDAVEGFVG
jgi:SAM-dependent methyltransferase